MSGKEAKSKKVKYEEEWRQIYCSTFYCLEVNKEGEIRTQDATKTFRGATPPLPTTNSSKGAGSNKEWGLLVSSRDRRREVVRVSTWRIWPLRKARVVGQLLGGKKGGIVEIVGEIHNHLQNWADRPVIDQGTLIIYKILQLIQLILFLTDKKLITFCISVFPKNVF